MVDYCPGPNHVNDAVDAAIMSRNTTKVSTSLISASNPKHMAMRENPWMYTIDGDGKEVGGKEALDIWAGGKAHGIAYVARGGEAHLVEMLLGEYRMADSDVQVPLGGPIGKFVGRNASLEFLLKQTLFDEVHGLNPMTKAWIDYLADHGYDSGNPITAIGTENMTPEAAIWYRTAITVNKYMKKIAEKATEKHGINNYKGRLAYLVKNMLHEIGHNRGVKSEVELETMLKEFYEGLADKCSDPEEARIYRALAREAEEYAEGHAKGGNFWDKFVKAISLNKVVSEEKLYASIAKYEAVGREKGYEGKELTDYVERKLKEESKEEKSGDESEDNESREAKESSEDSDDAPDDPDSGADGDSDSDGGDSE